MMLLTGCLMMVALYHHLQLVRKENTLKKLFSINFNPSLLSAVLSIRYVPRGLYYLEKTCDKISDMLSPIPLPGTNLGTIFWDNINLPLINMISKREKHRYMMLPWLFAKSEFPEEYKESRKKWSARSTMYISFSHSSQLEAAADVYREWVRAYDKLFTSRIVDRIKAYEAIRVLKDGS